MAGPLFDVHTRVESDEGVVAPQGEIDVASAPRLVAAARELRDNHALRRLLIDLRDVEFIDSSGLTALLQLRREFADAPPELAVHLPQDDESPVRRTFEISGVLPLLGLESS